MQRIPGLRRNAASLARPAHLRDSPLDCSPARLLMPFGFHLAMDTLPSENIRSMAPGPPWLVSNFRFRALLGFSIPSIFSGQQGITPAFGSSAPHSSARWDWTPRGNAVTVRLVGDLLPYLWEVIRLY
jgi:hypothetical protein